LSNILTEKIEKVSENLLFLVPAYSYYDPAYYTGYYGQQQQQQSGASKPATTAATNSGQYPYGSQYNGYYTGTGTGAATGYYGTTQQQPGTGYAGILFIYLFIYFNL
jgi:hypothetical protein